MGEQSGPLWGSCEQCEVYGGAVERGDVRQRVIRDG